MANISLKEIFPSDSLVDAIEKINFNFDQVILGGGGPQGEIGQTGAAGGQGPIGERGNFWFAGSTYGGLTADYFGNPLELGDGFINSGGTVYIYSYTGGSTGWLDMGINLKGPSGPNGATGSSFEWQYFRGATDIGVNSWIPATAYGATTMVSTNRDILSYIGAEKNIVFMGSTGWAIDQLSDFGYYPSGSNSQKNLPTLTAIQRYIDNDTVGGIAIGAVGLTSATGASLPTPGDLNEGVSALDFMYLGFEETSTDPWYGGAMHRGAFKSPRTSFAIRIGGNGALENAANFLMESQFYKFTDYLDEKTLITGNYNDGTNAGFVHLYSKNIGLNPTTTGTGKQGFVVLQGVEGSYSIGSYQHRFGSVIIGSTAGMAGNIISGLIISRGNTGGITTSNNYDSHISLHADNTANAVSKMIASVDSIGIPRTQFVNNRIGLISPYPGATGSTGFTKGSWNSESYTPKVSYHKIIDSGNLTTISVGGGGISGIQLPSTLSGARMFDAVEVRDVRGGGHIFGLTPAYTVTSLVSGATSNYLFDDIIWQTFAKGATNPTPNIWINPGATAIGGAVFIGLTIPSGGTYSLLGQTGQYYTSKVGIGGAVSIATPASTSFHTASQPIGGARIQGTVILGTSTNNPGASASYTSPNVYISQDQTDGGVQSEVPLMIGDYVFLAKALGQYQWSQAQQGAGGIPSNFAFASQGPILITGKTTSAGDLAQLQDIRSTGYHSPNSSLASLMIGGVSYFGGSAWFGSWKYGSSGPYYTGGLVANVGVFGDPVGGATVSSYNLGYPESAILSANSTTKGFAMPRMSQTQRTAIASPAVGLMVYQVTGTPGAQGPTGQGVYTYVSPGGWTGPMRFS